MVALPLELGECYHKGVNCVFVGQKRGQTPFFNICNEKRQANRGQTTFITQPMELLLKEYRPGERYLHLNCEEQHGIAMMVVVGD
jgi:hypothetical protein